MISYIQAWLLEILHFLEFETNPLDGFLQGLVSTCGIFVLRYLSRVILFIRVLSNDDGSNLKGCCRPAALSANGWLTAALQFCCLTGNLALVGSRVASLVALEFSLRLVSSWATAGPASLPSTSLQIFAHSQFSLGCALSCGLHFLHDGAPKRSLNLFLAAGLSLLLACQCGRLWRHVTTLYPLHSSQRSCGICISLLTSGHSLQALLCHSLKLAFGVAAVAAIATLNHHFTSASEALRFWTPLIICYALLVVYIQEEQPCRSSGTAAWRTVAVRLGAPLLLMLTVGRWTDVLHVLLCFLGEACCLVPSQDLWALLAQELVKEDSCNPKQTANLDTYSEGSPQPVNLDGRKKKSAGIPGRGGISQVSRTDALPPSRDLKSRTSCTVTKWELCSR